MKSKHRLLIFHVDFDLISGFCVADCEGGVDCHAGVVGVGASA